MQVLKWGDDLAVRLPAAVVEALGLKDGDEVEVEVSGARQFADADKPDRAQLLARLKRFRGTLAADWRFDRDDLNAQ